MQRSVTISNHLSDRVRCLAGRGDRACEAQAGRDGAVQLIQGRSLRGLPRRACRQLVRHVFALLPKGVVPERVRLTGVTSEARPPHRRWRGFIATGAARPVLVSRRVHSRLSHPA
jgi:hypothetical protein